MSPRAWEAQKTSNLPKFYLDLSIYQKNIKNNNTPFTPSVNLYFALEAALEIMEKEGLTAIFKRHNRHKTAVQEAMKAMNLPLFAEEANSSPAITAVAPEGIDAEIIRKIMKEKYDILLAGGQDHLKGKVFRIGHLGFVNDRDIITVVSSIEATIHSLDLAKSTMGNGLAAALKILS